MTLREAMSVDGSGFELHPIVMSVRKRAVRIR
jgi:hypothetical protein